MKWYIVVLLSFSITIHLKAQSSADGDDLQKFIVLYTLGESWDATKNPQEQTYFADHSAHLQSLRKDSVIVIGARYSDTGMLIIQARDETAAHELIKSDLAIKNELFKVEIHMFSPFYKGCVE